MLRALRLGVAYDLLGTDTQMTSQETCNFLLFCSTWRAVLKLFVRFFRIKASEGLEKSLVGAVYKEEK